MDSDLDRVKSILLGEEYADLIELKNEFQNSEAFAQAVAAVIAEALEARGSKDDRVAEVLAPAIDRSIASSIDQDPKKLAESLYPIMGPAIRKSISETLQQMLENFNQLLEQSLSPKSLRWRFDAWRTGRSYSELVLLNTLEYEVEQVFLIHQETSLLIQHVYSDMAEKKDPDMVSSMFSAIQDFIEDSFSVSEGDLLDTLRLGELSVVIQRGPLAAIAAVVRGNIPEHLRESMQNKSELIHRTKRQAMQNYSGDPEDFLDITEDLQSILEFKQKQAEEEERSIPWLAIATITVIVAIVGYTSYRDYQENIIRTGITQRIDGEPGVVVLSTEYEDGAHVLTALVDPLAEDILPLLDPKIVDMDPSRLITYPYLSADDPIIVKRANRVIDPPDSVELSVVAGRLFLSGKATVQWFNGVSTPMKNIPGISATDTEKLTLVDPVFEKIQSLTASIESFTYTFEKEAIDLLEDDPRITVIAGKILELLKLQEQRTGINTTLDIVGYTDDTGPTRLNQRIGLRRAKNLMSLLIAEGVPAAKLAGYNSFDYHETEGPASREVRIYLTE